MLSSNILYKGADKMKVGAAYIRVSTNMQEELSPDAQKRLIIEYAQKNDIVLTNEFIFIENGISGKSADKRPEFQRMIATAKSKPKPFDVILLWKFSRFARNQDEAAFYKGMLRKKCEIDVISITEPIMEGMYGRLIEMIIEWNDEFYSYNLSQEVARGMTEKALRGGYQARPPLGYKMDQHNQTPVVVPEEAKIVKLIFEKYVNEEMDLYNLTKYLNQIGALTSRGKPFEKRSLEYIIQNPTYIGKIRWNRTENATNRIKDKSEWIIADGNHEKIISEDLFNKANERYHSEYTPRNARPSATMKHWLSGMLKCSACTRTLSSSYQKDKRYNRIYYNFQCYGYLKGKCNVSHGISGKKIEGVVLNMIKSDLKNQRIQYEILLVNKINHDLEILENQLAKVAMKETRIKEAYMNGIDTIEEYKSNKEILAKERISIEAQIAGFKTENTKEANDAAMYERVSNVYDILISDQYSIEKKNKAIKSVIKKIIYNKPANTVDIYYYYS